jgi:endonuclease III
MIDRMMFGRIVYDSKDEYTTILSSSSRETGGLSLESTGWGGKLLAVLEIERQVTRLERFYGPLPSPPQDPFMVFVWEVLSAQGTIGQRRDAAMAALRRLPALTPDSVARAPKGKLEAAILLTGSYVEQRLRALLAGADAFRRNPELPRLIRGRLVVARRAIAPLPLPGDGGIRRMLLFAGDHLVLPVDSRMARVGARLALSGSSTDVRKTARRIRRAARGLAPHPDAYRRTYLYLSHHGAATCTEGDPHCTVCPLLGECSFGMARVGGASADPALT